MDLALEKRAEVEGLEVGEGVLGHFCLRWCCWVLV